MSELNFIYLSEEDMIKAGVRDMGGCIKSMEEAFVLMEKGDYRMGGPNANEHGIKLCFPDKTDIEGMPTNAPDRRFMAMPAYLGGKYHMCGMKCYGSNQENKEKGLPRSILMMSLMDPQTGVPLAYMSANILSAMRTAAVTGLGAKYLARKEIETISIIGPGVMGRYALASFMETHPEIKHIKIKGRSSAGIQAFIDYSESKYHGRFEYEVCETVEEACKDSYLVYFGTTNASKFEDNPYLKEEYITPGATVISASALLMNKEFLGDKNKCKVVADQYSMYEDWGRGQKSPTQRYVSTLLGMCFYDAVMEGKLQKESITNIGEIIMGKKTGRDNDDQILIYAVGGLPIEDVAWGYECYQNAKNNNIGTILNIWKESQL